MIRIALLRDVDTPVGTFSAGCQFEAEPWPSGWLVQVLPTRTCGADHSVLLSLADASDCEREPS